MIKISRDIVRGLRAARHHEEVYPYLQHAIELEHSTIPPYLTALFSLKPGTNDVIADLIRSIVGEEMLHLNIVANILIAIGGQPVLNDPRVVPSYPGHLPMSIGGAEFEVGIEAFSKELVQRVFMTIEEPEHPLPIAERAASTGPETFATIGEFYAALKDKLSELGDRVFRVDHARQVLHWFDAARLFPVRDVASATRAIDIIVREGEGTSTQPFEQGTEPAHYYKFAEIVHGKRIVVTPDGFAYAGDPIPFDAAGVYPMKPNPRAADFPAGSQAQLRVARYSQSYSKLLSSLHIAFNGQPRYIDRAIGLMYELKTQAVALMQTPLPDGSGQTAGPSYEYAPL